MDLYSHPTDEEAEMQREQVTFREQVAGPDSQ
jgi:hypothetical protein